MRNGKVASAQGHRELDGALISDSLFEGVVVFNGNGSIILANKSAEAILGLTIDQMRGRFSRDPRWRAIHEDGTPFHGEHHPSMVSLRTGKPVRNVMMGVHKPDGSLVWVTINAQPVFSSGSSRPQSVTCSFVDITSQRKLIDDLKASHDIQRLVLTSTSSGFYLLDETFHISMLNKSGSAYARIVLEKEMVVGDHLPSIVPPERKPILCRYLQRALKGKETIYVLDKAFAGNLLYYQVMIRPVFNDQAKVVGIYIVVRDITMEKRAEIMLRASEKRFKALFHSAHSFIVLLSNTGEVLEANRSMLNFAGLQSSEVTEKKAWDTVLKVGTDHELQKLKASILMASEGNFVRFDCKIEGQRGIVSEIDFSLKPIKDETGAITQIIGEGRILDEQKRAERQLRETERQFGRFMENTPTYTWIVDENNMIRYVNPPGLKDYGLTNAVIGKNISELASSDILQEYIANNKIVFSRQRPLETRERAIDGNGNLRVQHVYKFPLGADANGVNLMGGVAMDITSLVDAQQDLLKSNERYEYARKATSDAIWDWDLPGNKIYLAEASFRLFGCRSLVTDIDTRIAHIHPKDRARYKQSIESALGGVGDHWQEEYRFRTTSGRYKSVLDKAYIIRDGHHKAVRMIGAMQDVTSHRKLEKKLLQETINRKREIIKAIISTQEKEKKDISDELHDNVSQLLATCNLYIDVLIKKAPKTALLLDCKSILRSAIDELRNISHNLTPAAFKEKGLFCTVEEMIGKINFLGQLNIRLNFSDTEVVEKLIAPEMKTAIYRIIQEQIKNILKHAAASNVVITCQKKANILVIEIADDGKGFELEKLKRGLGLNNIQSRVVLFNGELFIKSAPKRGCKIRAEFPVNDEQA